MKTQMIHFKIAEVDYVIKASDLVGVADCCPFVYFDGLPEGVAGLVQWQGKIFPVISLMPNKISDLRTTTFLLSSGGDVALAVPGPVGVLVAQQINEGSVPEDAQPWVCGSVTSEKGEAYLVDVQKLHQLKPAEAARAA